MKNGRPPRQPTIVDPYVSVAPWESKPPLLPDPTTDPHVLTIKVPQPERTTVELGAGDIPGIRMETGTHVHLTARDPKTTIALGANGGAGVGGFPPGLAISTDGQLKEYVKGDAEQSFKSSLTVAVDKHAKWECYTTREVIAHHDSVDTRLKNQKTDIKGAYTLASGARTETVKGDYLLLMPGYKYTGTVKDHSLLVLGNLKETVNGTVTRTVGQQKNLYLGEKASAFVGAQRSYFAGLSTQMSLGLNLGMHHMRVETTVTNVSRRNVSIERVTTRFQDIKVVLDKKETDLTTSEVVIKKASLFILK